MVAAWCRQNFEGMAFNPYIRSVPWCVCKHRHVDGMNGSETLSLQDIPCMRSFAFHLERQASKSHVVGWRGPWFVIVLCGLCPFFLSRIPCSIRQVVPISGHQSFCFCSVSCVCCLSCPCCLSCFDHIFYSLSWARDPWSLSFSLILNQKFGQRLWIL